MALVSVHSFRDETNMRGARGAAGRCGGGASAWHLQHRAVLCHAAPWAPQHGPCWGRRAALSIDPRATPTAAARRVGTRRQARTSLKGPAARAGACGAMGQHQRSTGQRWAPRMLQVVALLPEPQEPLLPDPVKKGYTIGMVGLHDEVTGA
jgi:hypothetical protein